jgi:hypothetical protein
VRDQQREQQEDRRAQGVGVLLFFSVDQFRIGVTHHRLRMEDGAPHRQGIEDDPGDDLVESLFERFEEPHKVHTDASSRLRQSSRLSHR